MYKKLIVLAIALAMAGCIASCGGGSKVGEVCDLLWTKLNAACDLTNPAEAAIVANGLSLLYGEVVEPAEVMGTTQNDFDEECSTGYEEEMVGVTEEGQNIIIDYQITEINKLTTTDCTTMVMSLGPILGG